MSKQTIITLGIILSVQSFLFGATTFVLPECTYQGGSVINFLVSKTGTADNGAPYTIIIPEDVEFEIKWEAFDLTTLNGDVTVIIEGDDDDGGEMKFNKNGAKIVINTGDQIIIDPDNEEGLESENAHGQVKVDTDGTDYTGHGLDDIVEAGGVQGDGTLGAAPANLPVEWVRFSAIANGEEVLISWTTATEENNDYYQVEYSTDGVNFEVIAEITGAGTSDIENNYRYTHYAPANGMNYYRIRQVDFNGEFSFTSIMAVEMSNDEEQVISFSPATAQLDITVSEEELVQVVVFDMNGRVVAQQSNNGHSLVSINLDNLQSGIYVCSVKNTKGFVSTQKFFLP